MRLSSLPHTSFLAGQRQAKLVPCHVASLVVRPACRVTRRTPEHRTGHVARVIEQSKSSAEAFIESVREELGKERAEVEESVVAADLTELQQQVQGLEQQVCCVGAAWGAACKPDRFGEFRCKRCQHAAQQ